jgi:cytoskeletal protein RodZ
LTGLLDNAAIEIAPPKKGWSLLPLLVVLFLVSYGLMTLLIVEQGHTIQSQRNLIIDLFHDSATLTAMQGRIVHDNQTAQAEAKKHAQANQTPSTQIPSTQAPSNQTPSTQAAPQQHAKERTGKTAKPNMQLPAKPASDLLDRRRALSTI